MKRRSRKRFISVMLGIILLLSMLSACGQTGGGDVPSEQAQESLVLLGTEEKDKSETGTLSQTSEEESSAEESGKEGQQETPNEKASPGGTAAGKAKEAKKDASEDSGFNADTSDSGEAAIPGEKLPDEDGIYTGKEEVALYIHTYGKLPGNFITKKEAGVLGWSGGSLEPYAPGKSIGGDYFGNYEGSLPTKKGRTYHECDIDTMGAKSRGAKRIVYSNDGLIYYTEDHYETFELLYER